MEKILINICKIFGCDINTFFHIIQKNILIRMSYFSKKVAGKFLLIPYIVKNKQAISHSLKYLVQSINLRKERKLVDRVQNELIDVYRNMGLTVKKKQELFNIIKSNFTNISYLDNTKTRRKNRKREKLKKNIAKSKCQY